MKIIFFFITIIALTLANKDIQLRGSSCGGNCPQGDCQKCVCGSTANKIDINNWCKGANWDQSCCRCIANVASKGNSNYMRSGPITGQYTVGLFGIDGANGVACGAYLNYEYLCNPDVHLNCAYKIYQQFGNKFSHWAQAEACGC